MSCGVDPYHEKELFEDVCCYLDMTPGDNLIPDDRDKLRLFFTLFPKTWHTLFTNVPRDITNATENMDSMMKYMHNLYKGEQNSNKQADGKASCQL